MSNDKASSRKHPNQEWLDEAFSEDVVRNPRRSPSMKPDPIGGAINRFLEEGDDMDIEAAMQLWRDLSLENVWQIEFVRQLDKLESAIKSAMKTYGEVPDVPGVTKKISPVKGRTSADVAGLRGYANGLARRYPAADRELLDQIGHDIESFIREGEPGHRISIKVD